MISTQDQAQNEKRLTFKRKRLQPKSVWLTAALFDIRPRDRLSVGLSFTNKQEDLLDLITALVKYNCLPTLIAQCRYESNG